MAKYQQSIRGLAVLKYLLANQLDPIQFCCLDQTNNHLLPIDNRLNGGKTQRERLQRLQRLLTPSLWSFWELRGQSVSMLSSSSAVPPAWFSRRVLSVSATASSFTVSHTHSSSWGSWETSPPGGRKTGLQRVSAPSLWGGSAASLLHCSRCLRMSVGASPMNVD